MSASFLAAASARHGGDAQPSTPPAAADGATSEGKLRERVRTSKRQPCVTLVPPSLSTVFNLEHSIHRPSRLLRDDIELVFRPDLDDEYRRHEGGAAANVEKADFLSQHLLVVPTWQPAKMDLSEIAEQVNVVRRGLLESFDDWAARVRKRLLPYWSDCSCPVDGCARYGTKTPAIYNELDGLVTLLKYDALPVGCCGIVIHPRWFRSAYPVTFFTTAPLEKLQAAIAEAERERQLEVD
ncbi:hypothetical protein AB1Y20_019477 [Prymnesium parvum]|uniref:Uncharacterized protein n=1 Tax=Prymnesium parvum TaxID=97485 RepID=A0AB34JU93_PRYPA